MPQMKGHMAAMILTGVATAPVTGERLVGFDDAPAGADAVVKGMAKRDAATGEAFDLIALGLVEMEAATAIARGALVYSDADGKATSVGANNPVGRAVRAAADAGDVVAILMR